MIIIDHGEGQMTIQMVIIGLGQIGASLGLALAEQKNKIRCQGFDADSAIERLAMKMKAVENVTSNLTKTVANSDLVMLALPTNGLRGMLEIVAPHMRAGAVLMDVAPAKEAMLRWTQELLPAGRYYVGLSPAINAAYLEERGLSLKTAHQDLFSKGLVGIVSSPGTPPEAIRLATDLVSLLGAEHLFFDAVEVDSLMAAVHLLPQLAGAALVDATIQQPGWREGRKLAGRPYADLTGALLHSGGPEGLADAAVLSSSHLLRLLDNLIMALQDYRAEIQAGEAQPLQAHLHQVYEDRLSWWAQRQNASWLAEDLAPHSDLPTGSQTFKRLVIGERKPKTKL
jgi:prephenate dehydrogenase